MANRQQFKMSISQRRVRHFSDSFKSEKVREIESGQLKISDLVKEYEVSQTSFSRWINKYGTMKHKKPSKLIVESDSDTKKMFELQKRVAELERIVGQKQILIDYKDKMIDLAEEHYKVDIKKTFLPNRPLLLGKQGRNDRQSANIL